MMFPGDIVWSGLLAVGTTIRLSAKHEWLINGLSPNPTLNHVVSFVVAAENEQSSIQVLYIMTPSGFIVAFRRDCHSILRWKDRPCSTPGP
jgi:hypothetical protein